MTKIWLVVEQDWDYGPAPVAAYENKEDAQQHLNTDYSYSEICSIEVQSEFKPEDFTKKGTIRADKEDKYGPD